MKTGMCDTQLLACLVSQKAVTMSTPYQGWREGPRGWAHGLSPNVEVPPPPEQLCVTCPSTGTTCIPEFPQISGFSGSPASLAHLSHRAGPKQALKQSVNVSPCSTLPVYLLNKVHPSLEWLFTPTAPRLGWRKGEQVCPHREVKVGFPCSDRTSGSITPREVSWNKGQLEKTEEVESFCCKLSCSEQPTEPDTRLCCTFWGDFSHLLCIGSSDPKCLPNEWGQTEKMQNFT